MSSPPLDCYEIILLGGRGTCVCEQFAKSKVRTRTRDLLIVQSSVLTVTPPGHTMSTMARSIIIIFIRLKINRSIQKISEAGCQRGTNTHQRWPPLQLSDITQIHKCTKNIKKRKTQARNRARRGQRCTDDLCCCSCPVRCSTRGVFHTEFLQSSVRVLLLSLCRRRSCGGRYLGGGKCPVRWRSAATDDVSSGDGWSEPLRCGDVRLGNERRARRAGDQGVVERRQRAGLVDSRRRRRRRNKLQEIH